MDDKKTDSSAHVLDVVEADSKCLDTGLFLSPHKAMVQIYYRWQGSSRAVELSDGYAIFLFFAAACKSNAQTRRLRLE